MKRDWFPVQFAITWYAGLAAIPVGSLAAGVLIGWLVFG